MNPTKREVVLAFSGGLDTSFCVPYLQARGDDVVTVFVDTGGVSAEERAWIEGRARELGAVEHITVDGAGPVWDEVVVPMIQGGAKYQGQYPLLCSDRYIIVRAAIDVCRARGTNLFAHGCTGMGNDQVRFDLTARALGDFEIIAPIREIQQQHQNVRAYEQDYLRERGFEVPEKYRRYTINQNVLGVTVSGSEIDEFQAPSPEAWQLSPKPCAWPSEAIEAKVTFERGVAVALDGERLDGPALLSALNARFAACGVGRAIYTGDTTIGLKGRIIFEAPGLEALFTAHRALEEAVASRPQNDFKPTVAKKWVELVYQGFFYEPLKYDLEAFLAQSQRAVNGVVTLSALMGNIFAVAIDSPHILKAKGAVYAQSATWSAGEAEGFIKLFGQSSTLSAQINPVDALK